MKSLISEHQVDKFLYEMEKNLPNFVAGVITDRHGFPIGARIPKKKFKLKENELAISAIANNRAFVKDSKFLKFRVDLDQSKHIRLLILCERKNMYLNRFIEIQKILRRQDLF